MKAIILGFVAALLLATPALADISSEERFQGAFRNLMAAVSSETEGLGDGELSKDEKKALKGLQKASKIASKLDEVGIDKKSLKKVGKIVKTLEKVTDTTGESEAKSVGLLLPAVQSAMEDLVFAIRSVIEAAENDAEGQQDELDISKNIEKVGKALDKALGKLDGANELWLSHGKWAKAWGNWIKAWAGCVKAETLAQKFYEKEQKAGGGVAGLTFDVDGKLVNKTGEDVQLTDLIYDLTFKVPDAPKQSIKLKLSEISPESLPIDLGTDAFDPALYSSIWQNLKFIPGISITGKIVYVTTAGNLTFNFK
ncbi:MAG: hypothetical protein ABFS86_04835 [Planctomycetota bacterium]